jgi:ABC-type lipoprotein export system ATPase subunit
MTLKPHCSEKAPPAISTPFLIDIQGLCRRFGKRENETEVLSRLSLQIPEGSFTVIRGPSGSGKTTLLRILGLLDQNYSGRFVFGDKEVNNAASADLDQLRTDSIGFVFQEGRFLEHLTLRENIALPLKLRGEDTATIQAPLMDVARFVFRASELDAGVLDIRPAQASGGQRQRAALARALITRPRLILADEPTANLDPASREQVLERLRALHQTGVTIVVVSHDTVFFDFGTQLELLDGRLVSIGASDAPLAQEIDPALPLPFLSFRQRWKGRLRLSQLFAAASVGIVRRPLLSALTLISLVAGICQVAILASLLGGVDRVVEQALLDGSRLIRVSVRPRSVDLPKDDRFPLRADIAMLPIVTDLVPRRMASFAILMPGGAEIPYTSMGLHPKDPELRFFQFLAGNPDTFAQDDFGLIGTPGFLTEVLQLGARDGSIDWEANLGQTIQVIVPRFDRNGQRIGHETVMLRVTGVILSGESGRQFYVTNRMLLATDAIRRDRSHTLALPLTHGRSEWTPDADLSVFLNWAWEDMLHVYIKDIDNVLPSMGALAGMGYRPESEIWDYLWILDLKEAAMRIFIPMLGLLVIVISLVLISNVYVSARLRQTELALCRVLGLTRGDLLATEILSIILLSVAAIVIGLFGAQALIDLLSAHFASRAELLAGLNDAAAAGVPEALFSPVIGIAPHICLGTIILVVIAVMWPAIRVARTDPALVFTQG